MDADNEGLKKLFNIVLGTNINVKDNIDETEELVFKSFIKKLENSYKIENEVFEAGGIDLTKVTDGLWFVVENTFKMLYGEEACEIIIWYIYDRFNPDGSIVPLEGPSGKEFILKDSNDLLSFIKYKSNK